MSVQPLARENALPRLVQRAAAQLAKATSAAEVLEARNAARFARDDAKRQASILKSKSAHGEVIAAVRRSQADALEIEALADRRLADEYDAAQERGEVVGAHNGARNRVPEENAIATVADLGLTRKDIHAARQIRDAEHADPGIIRRTLDEQLAAGSEPTKAALKNAVADINAAKKRLREVEAAPKASPLTPEEREERKRIFGTPESRAAFGEARRIAEVVAAFPAPAIVAGQVPPALQHTVDIAALRSVARWFDGFCDAWEQQERRNVSNQ